MRLLRCYSEIKSCYVVTQVGKNFLTLDFNFAKAVHDFYTQRYVAHRCFTLIIEYERSRCFSFLLN